MLFPINFVNYDMFYQFNYDNALSRVPFSLWRTETIYQVMCPNIKFKEINWLNYFHHLNLLEYKVE